ncbi:hypothetical protein JCM10213_008296 [Rhodosporidiobolus nylandii]
MASQAERHPTEKPAVTSEQIRPRREEVFNAVQPIVTIPKPKAKVEEEPKREEAPAADAEMKDAPAAEEEKKEESMDQDLE